MNILIIDDDARSHHAASQAAQAAGHRATIVAGSHEALSTALHEPYDLALWHVPANNDVPESTRNVLKEVAHTRPDLRVVPFATCEDDTPVDEFMGNLISMSEDLGQPEHNGHDSPGMNGEQVVPGARISIKSLEQEHIRRIVESTQSLAEAAEVLGIDAATLYRKRKRYRIAQ
ncbi:regulatory Fis family protein [Roseimicrobium gellanilyticum]|uniref:Regulatory Fis family protein n=1 Tax=Roseimicrobium gellanilyticum TaxID=748857 RepID=A0A366H6Z9_9BACT|nr:helix-turn-helix domain-containing protein [Roseimicrobium gellanilyticum]RBP37275.1 regulatory Fis family protein [Roseimicrobium gellanilyticum]